MPTLTPVLSGRGRSGPLVRGWGGVALRHRHGLGHARVERRAARVRHPVRVHRVPTIAPTGCIWDIERNEPLAAGLRPKGDEVGILFRINGLAAAPNAMYAPWDRLAIADHAHWLTDAPHLAWHAGRTLTFILNELHRILHADAYLGI